VVDGVKVLSFGLVADLLQQCKHRRSQEKTMPQSPHARIAELHNLAAHAHSAAAAAHVKGDRLTAHELSKQAHEHSRNARKLSDELAAKASNA
jgi:hypothetical protein